MKKLLFIIAIALFSACQTGNDMQTAGNPFEQEWETPFGIPPFDLIEDEHYMPAFEKGMEENLAEIDAIVNNSEAPTFANTLEELERSGKLLTKVQRVFGNLASSNTNPKIQELQRELSPLLSAHYDKITLNEGLFKRVEAVWQDRENLSLNSEQLKFLNDTRKSFVRSGALLNKEEKAKITEINSKISELTTEFGQNLLAETNGFELILDKTDLGGLSEGNKVDKENNKKPKTKKKARKKKKKQKRTIIK